MNLARAVTVKVAVKTVKPLVGERRWARIKGAVGRPPAPAQAPAVAVVPAEAEPTPAQRQRQARLAMSLTELALEFGTDKATVHHYTEHYERHLRHLRQESFTLLEIGIGGYRLRRQGGESLRMWKWYFPKARIVGLDIEDKTLAAGGRVSIYQGSQVDPEVLHRIVEEHGPLQVVIDDGSHDPAHVRETFRLLFPLLPDGAIYAIEDLQTSYWPEWGGSEDLQDRGTSMAMVKDLIDGLNFEEFVAEPHEPSYTDTHVRAVWCYHNLVFVLKGDNREGTNRRQVLKERYAEAP